MQNQLECMEEVFIIIACRKYLDQVNRHDGKSCEAEDPKKLQQPKYWVYFLYKDISHVDHISLVHILVRNLWKLRSILYTYTHEEASCRHVLQKLERLNLASWIAMVRDIITL